MQRPAPGEFAQAYVIAHEVGHHIQNSLGQFGRVQQLQAAVSGTQKNALQVRVELQADCYAGVWAKNTDRINKTLEPGDIESALNAAQAIGDEAIQKSTRGYAVPDSFTHGTSEQRMRWSRRAMTKAPSAPAIVSARRPYKEHVAAGRVSAAEVQRDTKRRAGIPAAKARSRHLHRMEANRHDMTLHAGDAFHSAHCANGFGDVTAVRHWTGQNHVPGLDFGLD